MAQSGFTPIILFNSTTASNQPTTSNLAVGELAINIPDGKLYYNKSGTITVLATASTAALTVPINPANGGTGVANGTNNTITFTGNYTLGLTLTGNTAVTFPTSGTLVALGNANTFTGTQTFNGTSSTFAEVLLNAAETTTVSATSATGTIAYYPSTQSVLYYTSNASANWTVNLTFSAGTTLNSAMSIGQSLTVAFLVTQGGTAYYNSAVQVDGTTSGITTIWQNGSAPTSGNASSVDVYTYTIIKTASATFTVLASQTQFK
jgi:hypothetical protein